MSLREELDDIRELADSAEDIDQLRALVKSATSVAKRGLRARDDGNGRFQDIDEDDDVNDDGDIDEDDDLDGDGDIDDDDRAIAANDDDLDDEGDEDPRFARPAARQMKKSLSNIIDESGYYDEGVQDAVPIIGAVSEGLQENNLQAHQNYQMIKSLRGEFRRLVKGLSDRFDAIEDELVLQRPMIKSAANFVDSIRRTPSGTPTADKGEKVSGSALMSKSLGGAELYADTEEETFHGLTERELIKGLSSRLQKDDADHRGLSVEDLAKIGTVPFARLNPEVAKVAAEELGREWVE